ncbi:putative ribonuclease H-like domain-containing protein [Tanacetum coccineum]
MSMLEDRSSYINVSESAQDTDGEVNPTHAYYNGSRTSQDKEDPSWSTSIKTRIQRRHLQHWKRVGCHFIMLYLYLLGTLPKAINTTRLNLAVVNDVRANQGHPQKEEQGYVDSGCSRHMTGNMSYLSDFKEFDGGYVLLKVPRKNNMYSVDIKNIVPKESLTCLVAKATLDESMLWHRRLGHVNFKTINKLVKENLVRGLPTKHFENDQTCVSCLKGKQHKASYKSKILKSITQPLFMLHMDLFGPTFVSSLMNKKYCLVVTDDYSRFTWVFFLATKDETSGILKRFITEVENIVDKKVKIIRCDNGTEFKNRVMSEFCEEKGIKKEFSAARTP